MHKFLGGLLAAVLVIGCAAPIWADTVPRKAELDSFSAALEAVPTLTVAYNGKTQEAVRGSFFYNGLIADAPGPLQIQNAPVFQRREGIHTVGLSFSRRPDRIEVSCWDASTRGKTETPADDIQTLQSGIYTLPESPSSFILSAKAYWKKSGSADSYEYAAYVFEIAVGSAGEKQLPLEKLPSNYPPELAAANGDVTVSLSSAENLDRLYLFASMVKQGSAASVRIVSYTKEGDPVFYDLNYDGHNIRCMRDSSRDQFGEGKVSSEIYDSIELRSRYSGEMKRTYTDIELRSADGKGRLVASFFRPDAVLFVLPAAASGNEKTLRLEIENNTAAEMTCDETFLLERLTDSGWKTVPVNGNYQSAPWTAIIAPEESYSSVVSLVDITRPLAKGRYRIAKALKYGGKSKRAYAQFEVQETKRFAMGTPVSLTAVSRKAGVVTSLELTRKGRYAGSSPLVYVSGQLARLNGKPFVGTGGGQDGLITLTAGFADGSSRMLDFYADGRFRAADGIYQFGSSEVYENIKGCLEAVKNSK